MSAIKRYVKDSGDILLRYQRGRSTVYVVRADSLYRTSFRKLVVDHQCACIVRNEEVDQSDQGKVSNILVGTAGQITDMLKRYKEAGLTMPLLWPPFADVPVSKTLDDLKRLKEEIMPKVDAI